MAYSFRAATRTNEGNSLVVEAVSPGLRSRSWHFQGKSAVCVVLKRGEATLQLDQTRRSVEGSFLAWLAEPHGARLEVSAGAEGAILHVPRQLVVRSMPFSPLAGEIAKVARQTRFYTDLDESRQAAVMNSVRALMQENGSDQPGALEMQEAYLRLVIITLWRLSRDRDPTRPSGDTDDLTEQFRSEIVLRLRDQPSVGDIAASMGVSVDRLHRAVLRASHMTPKQLMHTLLLSEARRLLQETSLQIGQISVMLGFSDPAYFNRFFRQRTGTPPGRFRAAHRELHKPDATSYASWP